MEALLTKELAYNTEWVSLGCSVLICKSLVVRGYNELRDILCQGQYWGHSH